MGRDRATEPSSGRVTGLRAWYSLMQAEATVTSREPPHEITVKANYTSYCRDPSLTIHR